MMLEIDDLGIQYAQKVILKPSSLELTRGSFVALLGRNGSGKSSLLRCLARLQQPTSGQLRLAGQDYKQYAATAFARQLAIVNTQRIQFPYLTLRELVALGRHPHLGFAGRLRPKDQSTIDQALEQLDLLELQDQQLAQCSDGERQKAMLARALAQDSPILLLDEITAHLDFVNKQHSFQLLQQLAQDQNKLIIMATHELNLALRYAQQILLLHQQQLYHQSPEELKKSNLLDEVFKGTL